MNVEIMLLAPVLFGILCLAPLGSRNISIIASAGAFVVLVLTVRCCYSAVGGTTIDGWIWHIDRLSGFFLVITSFISFLSILYARDYLRIEKKEERLSTREIGRFYCTIMVFVAAMLFTFSVRSAALTWIGVGSTTMVSAFLVGLYKNEEATEAAWKYIMLCSVGITLALFGIAMLYTASSGVIPGDDSLDWPVLVANAASFNPVFMKFAAVFFIIGLGTKVGFAPLHNWLPDAHSQAPSPVSAMMSGVLLNCAMYGIMRFYSVSEIVNPGFAGTLLLAFGLLSLFVAGAFIIISKDVKRLLAYSSIENMGIIAVGLGIGTDLSIYGSLFIVMAHSVCKPLMFYCAGNITQMYGTRQISEIRGVGEKMRFTGFATSVGTLAIAGAPPFPLFVGELMILFAAVDTGMYWAAGALAVMLIMAFAGITKNIFPMLTGTTEKEVTEWKSLGRGFSLFVLICCALAFGLFMPDFAANVFEGMVSILKGGIL